MTLPTIMDQSGLQPIAPSVLRSMIVDAVAASNPGYTANLPGSLIEDLVSTCIAALSMCDQARVDLINSISPYGANEFLLNQLGVIYGLTKGELTNTSVNVDFTGTVGFIINQGFLVSDGTYQYAVQTGGIIPSGGTVTLYCLATQSGSWAVPENTVNQLITSVPSTITLTANNPIDGTPQTEAETWESYRARVLEAGQAISQGMATFLRTLLADIPGVQSRLISVRQASTQYKILCGGGDNYTVAYAIYRALFDITSLTGSATSSRNVNVTITDYPDSYLITFINPPAQQVGINLTWNTTATNIIADSTISILGREALKNYINSIVVGFPINLYELENTFIEAVASAIPAQYISKLDFEVYIDSVLTPPTAGTGLIEGDNESYFLTEDLDIIIERG